MPLTYRSVHPQTLHGLYFIRSAVSRLLINLCNLKILVGLSILFRIQTGLR